MNKTNSTEVHQALHTTKAKLELAIKHARCNDAITVAKMEDALSELLAAHDTFRDYLKQ